MSLRRTFRAKVLARRNDEFIGEILAFGEDDSPKPLNLSDPFMCLEFVEKQVRKRTRMHGIEDYEVTMNTLSNDESGIVSDYNIVRPWRYPNSEKQYKMAK